MGRALAPPPRDGWQDAVDEARPYRGATFRDHYEALAQACRLAGEILDRHPRRRELLAIPDPLPEASEILLRRLRRRHAPP